MPSDSLMAWLGPAADELTAEQIERVEDEARAIGERYPDPDEQTERDAALSVAVQYLLGETNADEVNRALVAARRREAEAFAAATWVGVMMVRERLAIGARPDKAEVARAVGINRGSLLKALGEL